MTRDEARAVLGVPEISSRAHIRYARDVAVRKAVRARDLARLLRASEAQVVLLGCFELVAPHYRWVFDEIRAIAGLASAGATVEQARARQVQLADRFGPWERAVAGTRLELLRELVALEGEPDATRAAIGAVIAGYESAPQRQRALQGVRLHDWLRLKSKAPLFFGIFAPWVLKQLYAVSPHRRRMGVDYPAIDTLKFFGLVFACVTVMFVPIALVVHANAASHPAKPHVRPSPRDDAAEAQRTICAETRSLPDGSTLCTETLAVLERLDDRDCVAARARFEAVDRHVGEVRTAHFPDLPLNGLNFARNALGRSVDALCPRD